MSRRHRPPPGSVKLTLPPVMLMSTASLPGNEIMSVRPAQSGMPPVGDFHSRGTPSHAVEANWSACCLRNFVKLLTKSNMRARSSRACHAPQSCHEYGLSASGVYVLLLPSCVRSHSSPP